MVKTLNKEELFAQDPDNFFHLNDILVAVSKADKDGQHRILINTDDVKDMGGVLFMLERHCNRLLDKITADKLQEKRIIKEVASVIGSKR